MSEISIFTEAYGCGEILKHSLQSFYKYNNYKVTIYGTLSDFEALGELKNHPNNVFIDLTNDVNILSRYNKGHDKSTYIFAKHILNNGARLRSIHFDSDTIFFEDVISDITRQLMDGYDLVAPRRCYKYNLNNRDDIRHQSDTICTYLFGIDNDKVLTHNIDFFAKMCRGHVSTTSDKILDCFDPVSYDILKKQGKIFFLDYNDYGSFNELGSRNNNYPIANNKMDFGKKLLHFAGVGSGCFNFKNKNDRSSYEKWSIKRYLSYNQIDKNVNFETMLQQMNEIIDSK